MDYVGQIFGNREVIKNKCVNNDWLSIGIKIPSRKYKYVLTKCLNCGRILPCSIKNLRCQPPKRCVFCSNIGNHSNVDTYTNSWTKYEDVAVCNVIYNKKIISFYVDADDYEKVKQHTWRISKKKQKYYVVTGSAKKGTMIYLHRMVMQEEHKDLEIDHIDGNSLNNRKSNLRYTDRQGNIDNIRATRIDNEIGIRGIVYCKSIKKYQVDFTYHGKRFYTKDWNSIEEAVWCRYCFEDYYNLSAIKNNPIAKQYLTLNEEKNNEIKQYVQDIILGNER